MDKLGKLYESGKVGLPDKHKAADLYGQAASGSNPYAYLHLAQLYAGGLDTTADVRTAYMWAVAAEKSPLPGIQAMVNRILQSLRAQLNVAELEQAEHEGLEWAENHKLWCIEPYPSACVSTASIEVARHLLSEP